MSAALFDWLVIASLRLAIVFVAALLIASVLRAGDVRARALLWRVTMTLMVVLCVFPVSPPHAGALPGFDPTPSRTLALGPEPDGFHAESSALAPLDSPLRSESAGWADRGAVVELTDGAPGWNHVLLVLWAAGASIGLLRLLAGTLGLAHRVRMSEPVLDRPWLDDADRMAGLFGLEHTPALRATNWRVAR